MLEPPEVPRAERRLVAGLLGIMLLTGACEARVGAPSIYDEGLVLVEASRLRAGELPGRDYEPTYGPLEPALLALAGPELLLLRLGRVACLVGVAASLAVCAWRRGSRVGAPLAVAAVAWARHPEAHPAILPLLASCAALELARGAGARRWTLLAGGCAGLTLLHRGDFGLVAIVAAASAPVVGGALRRDLLPGLRTAGLVLLGALPCALLAAGAALAGGLERALALSRATRAFMPYRALPYPLVPASLEELPRVLLAIAPLVAAAAGAALLVPRAWLAWRGRAEPPPRVALHLWAVLVGILPYAVWRPDRPHLLPAFAAAAGLACVSLRGLERAGEARVRALVGALALVVGVLLGTRLGAALQAADVAERVASGLPGLSGVLVSRRFEGDYRDVVEAVALHAPAGGAVYVGTGELEGGTLRPRHDRVFVNDALLYVVLGRPIGVRHGCFKPGVTTSEAIQREILADLERNDVRVVVLALGLWAEEPNGSLAPGSTLLDEALLARFRPVAMTRRFAVLIRR